MTYLRHTKIALMLTLFSVLIMFCLYKGHRYWAMPISFERYNGTDGADDNPRAIIQTDTEFSNEGKPVLRGQVTHAEIDLRFLPNTKDSCKDDSLSNPRTFKEWIEALNNRTLKFVPLYKPDEYFFSWEKDFLSKPPLTDLNALPDLTRSKVWFLQGGKHPILAKNVTCKKGEPLLFRVDVLDRNGAQRPLGGDEVRAWVLEDPNSKSGKSRAASGIVKDLRNGSYTATITPLWTGLSHLKIGVVYPREFIRATIDHKRMGSYRYVYGVFQHEKIEEVTLCCLLPNIPGRSCVCNLTTERTGPFYCGRPLDKRLTCQNFITAQGISEADPFYLNLTSVESIMAANTSRDATETVIKQDIVMDVTENGAKDPVPTPCYKTDPRKTWEIQSPRGYWTKDSKWTSRICNELEMTSEWVRKCLQSSTVLLVGDSNAVRIFYQLCQRVSCTYMNNNAWPNPLTGRNEAYDITIYFKAHEKLLYSKGKQEDPNPKAGMKTYLKSIPSTGKHVVIIHYYLHMTDKHLSVFHHRLVNLRENLRELFRRNKDVIVGIRGPHISTVEWGRNHINQGDVLGAFMIGIIRDVFKGLQNRVVFLDGWDMSIALRNRAFHPSNIIPRDMLRTLLAFKCK